MKTETIYLDLYSDQPDPDSTPDNDESDEDDQDSADIAVTAGGGAGGAAVPEEACEQKVIINEVAWAGTDADPQDEWIELRNLGASPVNLTGWTLRWRRKNPKTEEERRWKTVQLSGSLLGAEISACELAGEDEEEKQLLQLEKHEEDEISWLLHWELEEQDLSYYLLERRHDKTITNVDANLTYDTDVPYHMELSNQGDVIELINSEGQVVDTANAFDTEQGGWPAGNEVTQATMERTDPLGPDTEENWHTNLGIVTYGLDSQERPLIATAAVLNSKILNEFALLAGVMPTRVSVGEQIEVELELPEGGRKEDGWPWIRVERPYFTKAKPVGEGGLTEQIVQSSISIRYVDDTYKLTIDTSGIDPGRYNFWVSYRAGKVVLIPIYIAP